VTQYIVGIDPMEMDGHKLVVITYKITARTSYNTGAICVTGTANPSGASEFTPGSK
jgi:hypothetical protein